MHIDINLEDVILLKRADYDMRHGRTSNVPETEAMENLRYIQEEKERKRIQVDEILADPTSPEAIRLRAMQAAGVDIYGIEIPKTMPQLADVPHPSESMLTIYRPGEQKESKGKKKKKKKKKKQKEVTCRLSTEQPIHRLVPSTNYESRVSLGEYFCDPEEYEEKQERKMKESFWID